MALLEVANLVKSYGRRTVVKDVSFCVDQGEVVGLLGPNGAGKTTSFRMTTGMVTPRSGRVIFCGEDITHWPMYRRAQLGMGYLSQESSIFRKLSVEENVLAVLEIIPKLRSLGHRPNAQVRQELTQRVLERFKLTHVQKNIAATLSGGEKRRLEIARCLVTEPKLILLDEPFTGIDPITIEEIQKIVRDLRHSGIGILITDHNVRETLAITDRSYVITSGQVEAHGTPDEIVRHPVVIAKYLGQSFAANRKRSMPTSIASEPYHEPSLESVQLHEAQTRAASTRSTSAPAFFQQDATATNPSLMHERISLMIDALKTDMRAEAEQDLLVIGPSAIPLLLDALERRDLEIRRMAFHVLQRMGDGRGEFDPYAPEAHRRQQIERLRSLFLRKAS